MIFLHFIFNGENSWALRAYLTNVSNMLTASNWTTSPLTPCSAPPPVNAPIDFSFNHKPVETFATEIELK